MRINRLGRFLRRAPLLLLPLLAAACASSEGGGGGPSQDRTLDIVALTLGVAAIITIGALMYHDNRD